MKFKEVTRLIGIDLYRRKMATKYVAMNGNGCIYVELTRFDFI